MLPVFRSREIHREAGAALLLFVEAARAEQLTATFLRELTRYLEAARNNRELVFRPAA